MMAHYLRVSASLALIVVLGVSLDARTRKGDKLLKQGQAAELRMDWDKALEFYEQAVDESPGDAGYIIGMRRVRFQAGQKHVDLGQKLRLEGKVAEALAEFQKALLTDPSSAIAIQELKRTEEAMRRSSQPGAKAGDRALTNAEIARRAEDQR